MSNDGTTEPTATGPVAYWGRGAPPPTSPTSTTTVPSGPGHTITFQMEPRESEVDEEISDQDAFEILRGRFLNTQPDRDFGTSVGEIVGQMPWNWGNETKQDLSITRDRLLHRIVSMVPPEQRARSVFQYMDIRPVLAEIAITDRQSAIENRSIRVNTTSFSPEERVEAGKLLAEENTKQHDVAVNVVADEDLLRQQSGKPALTVAEYEARVAEIEHSWKDDPTTLTYSPDIAAAAGDLEGTDATEASQALHQAQGSSAYNDYISARDAILSNKPPLKFDMTNAELVALFQLGQVSWNDILKFEATKAEARAAGQEGVEPTFMVDTGGLAGTSPPGMDPTMSQHPGYWNLTDPHRNDKVSISAVNGTLQSSQWTDKEIANLQDKMIAAGYLFEPGTEGAPAELEVRWTGKGTDPATRNAWMNLMSDSVLSGKNMAQLLAEATVSKRKADDEAEAKNARDIVLTSSVGITQTANSLSKQVIGRELPKDQEAALIEYIHKLERTSQGVLNIEGSQEVEDVNVEAEVQRYIEQRNATEAGAYDVLDQFNTFNTIARRSG